MYITHNRQSIFAADYIVIISKKNAWKAFFGYNVVQNM